MRWVLFTHSRPVLHPGYLESACLRPPVRHPLSGPIDSHQAAAKALGLISASSFGLFHPKVPCTARNLTAHVPPPPTISKCMLETGSIRPPPGPCTAPSLFSGHPGSNGSALLPLGQFLCPSGKAWRPLPASLHKLAPFIFQCLSCTLRIFSVVQTRRGGPRLPVSRAEPLRPSLGTECLGRPLQGPHPSVCP